MIYNITAKSLGIRMVHTVTDPSYLSVLEDVKTSKCRAAPSVAVDKVQFFAPAETKLFRTLLKEQCQVLDVRCLILPLNFRQVATHLWSSMLALAWAISLSMLLNLAAG